MELVSFTGSVAIGKQIAKTAGYKKTCLELGGNSPLIVLDDADLDLAVTLAAEGSFPQQRSALHRGEAPPRRARHLGEFTERFVEKAREYKCGDPADPETRVGTVINEAAAGELKRRVDACGGRDLAPRWRATAERGHGANGGRERAPQRRTGRARKASVRSRRSSRSTDLEDAIDYYNSGRFGLSSGIVTTDLNAALAAAKRLRTGTTNINEVPGFRIESSPFGGVKDSGLGIKEGVIESIKTMSNVKTMSFPW